MKAEMVEMPSWARWLAIIFGIVALAVGVSAIVFYQTFGIALVVVLVSFALIVLGIERLIQGLMGKAMKVSIVQ